MANERYELKRAVSTINCVLTRLVEEYNFAKKGYWKNAITGERRTLYCLTKEWEYVNSNKELEHYYSQSIQWFLWWRDRLKNGISALKIR